MFRSINNFFCRWFYDYPLHRG